MTGSALAIHPGALGDVLLAVPALRAFARGGDLTLAAQTHAGGLLAALGIVTRAAAFDDLRLDTLFVEDGGAPAFPPATRLVSWFGSREPVYARRLRALVPDVIVAPSTGAPPVWRHLLVTVGDPPGDWRDPIPVAPALERQGAALLVAAGWSGSRPLVVAHVGASGAAKRWPAEAFAAVLDGLGATVVLHAGPLDDEAAAAVAARLAARPLVLRHPPLPGLAGALRAADAFVGNDSGISHLAAAVGVPSVVVHAARHAAWTPWSTSALPVTVALDAAAPADVLGIREALAAVLAGRRAA